MSIGWQNDWARWRAYDSDGRLYEYELKPHPKVLYWVPAKGAGQHACVSLGASCPHWRDTLEARPVESGEPKTEAGGWTPWPGGDMPVDGDTLVDVQFRDGSIGKETPAGRFRWQHIRKGEDIVAYRISQPAPEAQSEPAAESHDDGTLTGAALHRAIADAIDAGEGPEAFEHWTHMLGRWATHRTFKGIVAADIWGEKIRRKPATRTATLPNGEVVEWPAPITTEPSRDQFVFRAEPGERNSISFRFNPTSNLHQRLLRARVLYADSDLAEKHGIAIAKLNGGDVTDAD